MKLHFIKKVLIWICVFMLLIFFFFLWRRQSRTYTIHLQDPVTVESVDQLTLNIGTYNVKSLNMGKSLDAFRDEIQTLDLDVICLQEVDEYSLRSGNMGMVREMAESTGYPYYYFYQSLWMGSGYYGLGILSKYPILEVSSSQLPSGFHEPRILAEAKIEVPGRILNIFNTHLSYEDPGYRMDQIEKIKERVTEFTSNTLLMGDFNSFHVAAFDRDYFTIPNMESINGSNGTLITFRDFGRPDNIYYTQDIRMIKSMVLPTTFSDHNLLYAQFQLTKP